MISKPQHKVVWQARLAALGAVPLLTTSFAWAAPVITESSTTGLGQNRVAIQVQGAGFGEKTQTAPVLVDSADYALENGVFNDRHASLGNNTILQDYRDQDITFNTDNVWTVAKGNIAITSERPPRHDESSEYYFFEGPDSWVGNPIAYGGQSGWDTPDDNSQPVIQTEEHTYSLLVDFALDYLGAFEEGEALEIGGFVWTSY